MTISKLYTSPQDYLTHVEPLADASRRLFLRQVTKLALGEGIRYRSREYVWPEDCWFLKGTKIGPTDDIMKLTDIARECEEEWGCSHGILRYPLKKLYMFQQYYLRYHHELSPYERLRLERIKRNKVRLTSLGLIGAKKNLAAATRQQPSSTPAPAPKRIRTKRDFSKTAVSSSSYRSSRRLEHKPAQYQAFDKYAVLNARNKLKNVLSEEESALKWKEIEGTVLSLLDD